MDRIRVKTLLAASAPVAGAVVKGWLRTRRDAKDFCFLELNDGSCLGNLQIIAHRRLANWPEVSRLTTGSALVVTGDLVASGGKGQRWDLEASAVQVVSLAPESYPLQKKRHTDEYLRSIAHLRPRTNKYGAAFRVRSEMAWAIHHFFRERGFWYIHTPIITASDCEGAGELFRVTTVDPAGSPSANSGFEAREEFFGRPAHLTVSGQLEAELMAMALGDVYTFGPTFRAENSNTRRHAAEFWMVEPEMAFCDLAGTMALAEALIRALLQHALEHCSEDLSLCDRFVAPGLLSSLQTLHAAAFTRLSYREATALLERCGRRFEHPVSFGVDLQAEHEHFLTDEAIKGPVILYDYPAAIKPFYMRRNADGQTVSAMDVLVPGIGELVGGSQREERLDHLEQSMHQHGLNQEHYWWYLDTRRFGSVPHSGFGLGFERLLMLVTGIRNIRDVIPFPRTPRSVEF
jgi:asparaginyl-tRNA synthetase